MGKVVKSALKESTPVIFGYIPLGMAYGFMMADAGFHPFASILTSIFVFAGSAQVVSVSLIAAGTSLSGIGLIIFLLNSRHMFYGISLFDKYAKTGKKKPYLIFSLTDETYAVLTNLKDTEDENSGNFYFLISLFDQMGWVLGTVLGAVAGNVLPINSQGMSFALNALFLVILMDQMQHATSRTPFLVGIVAGVLSLMFFGGNMLLAGGSLAVLLTILLRKRMEQNAIGN